MSVALARVQSFLWTVRADIDAFATGRDLTFMRRIALVFIEPGVNAVFLYRVQELLRVAGHSLLARLARRRNLRRNGFDCGLGATIGKGLVVRHPVGVVIGYRVQIGDFCTILQNVTIGERLAGSASVYPTIGNNVTIGCGATVLGYLTIGDDVVVGASSVVLKNVREGIVVAGAPAREVGSVWVR